MRFRNIFLFFACLVFTQSALYAETMYLTFVEQGNAAIEKKDVSLKIGKDEIPVTEFFAVDAGSRTPQLLQHPAGRRSYILVFDLIFSRPEDVIAARKWAAGFLAKKNPDDLTTIGAITKQDGLKFYCDLTADREKIVTALNLLGQSLLTGYIEGPDGNPYSSPFTSGTRPVSLSGDSDFMGNLRTTKPTGKNQDLAPLYVQSLTELTSLLSVLHGRKNVILFSPGTDVKGLSMNLPAPAKKKGETGGESSGQSTDTTVPPELGTITAPRSIEERSAGGPSGVPERKAGPELVGKLMAGTDAHIFVVHPSTEENKYLKELTRSTGGAFYQPADASAVDAILNSDRKFYVVGWNGEAEQGFTSLHPMRLTASQTELPVAKEWLAPKVYSDYNALEKKSHVAEAVYKNFAVPSSTERFWADFIFGNDVNQIPVFAAISGSELLKDKATKADWEFHDFLIKPDGSVVDFTSANLAMDLRNPKLREQLQKAGVKVWGILFSDHGPVNIRSVIVNAEDGKTITQTMRLEFEDSGATMSVPFFPDSNLDWIAWPKMEEKISKRGVEIKYPYIYGSNFFFPDLSPVIGKNDKGKAIYVKLYNFPPNPPVHLQFVGSDGTAHDVSDFGLMFQPNQLAKNGTEVFWSIKSLPDLSPGKYRFRVNIGTENGKGLAREIPAVIR